MANSAPISRPYRIGFLLIDGFALMSYASAVEPLRAANLLSDRVLYDVFHLAENDVSSPSSGGAKIPATMPLDARHRLDCVFVVAGGDPAAFHNPRVARWLRRMDARGTLMGGISGGPVILALAGMMEGRRMTVHWEHAGALAEISPSLMVERTLYVRDRDRLTCAGGIAPLDMMHAFITEHHGGDFARSISDWFMHTDIRPSGGPQRAGLAERHGVTSFPLIVAIEAMENHIADPLELGQLAVLVGLSKRQLNRLCSQKLGAPTMAFYRNLRLDKARSLLRQSPLSITEISLATGFGSSAHLSDRFRQRYGVAPSSVRKEKRLERR
ncbi:MAG: GlxA family transcriptional regulator [Hyphomicrobiaceae bacterium]